MATWSDLGIDAPANGTGEFRTRCPQCTPTRKPANQRDKDLACNLADGTFYCHHCGWSGGLSSTDWRERSKPAYAAPRPLPAVSIPTLWESAVQWFAARGIPAEVLVAKGITASQEFCPVCNDAVGHVLFPYYVNGQHINTKHRCGKKHFRMEKGAQRVLYNLDACAETETVVIVEGEMDALSCHVAGYPNTISVPDGAPAPDAGNYQTKFSFLEAAEAFFAQVRTVILATDADAPGQKLMDELARRIGPEKCARVIWPEGIKDANECLVKMGVDALRSRLDGAEFFPVEGIYTGANLTPDLVALYRNGADPGLTFGVPALDDHYRIKPGFVSTVTGIPSHGKSTVLDQLLMWLAVRHDWRFALFSPEQQPLVLHQQQLIEMYTGKPFAEGERPRMSEAEMLVANAWVADRFAFILPEETSIDTILDLARIHIFRTGARGIVIDPWNELEHARPRHQTETEYISDALGKLRRFARLHDIHLWIVAHPTKMRRTDDGDEPIPTLWDISGSAHFRNKADIGLTVWRDLTKDDDTVELHVTKMRFLAQGKTGHVRFGFDRASKRLFQIAQEVSR